MVRYSDIHDKLSADQPEEEGSERSEPTESIVEPNETVLEPTDSVPEPIEPDETHGISDVERDVLGELTGLDIGSTPDEPSAPELPTDDHNEDEPREPIEPPQQVSQDDVFAELDEQTVEADEASAEIPDARLSADEPSTEKPPAEGPLTETETVIHQEVAAESERIIHEELPEMFTDLDAQPLTSEDEQPLAEEEASASVGGMVSVLTALPMEILNLPARWLGPSVLTGLGLAGVFLLIALFVVILVQTVMG